MVKLIMDEENYIVFEEKSEYRRVNLENRLIDFTLGIDKLCEQLPPTKLGIYITDHTVRSSASSAFHYGEAQSAESRNDFIHKMKVCLKELRECFVGLKILRRGKFQVSSELLDDLYNENNTLISIFVKSIQTARGNK